MSAVSFGQVIPVLGPVVGFPGTISRIGERVIAARQNSPDSILNLNFGESAVLVPDETGGTFRSVKDYIVNGGGISNVPDYWAGIAVREVKTMLTYPQGVTPGLQTVGYYAPGEMSEVLERGSIAVRITNGTPQAGGQVYLRTVANGALPATAVGDLEAVADGGNTIALPNTVFRTGVLDANGVAEITILVRHAA